MPYFPTYQEMQDALEHARLKMWHTHGKVVDFGGPEFVLYALEGLGEMEAPKILDEPLSGEAPQGSIDQGMEGVGEPTKVTVTKSFGIDADTRGDQGDGEDAVGDGAVDPAEEVDGGDTHEFRDATASEGPKDASFALAHEFKSDRGGKNCLECGEPEDHVFHQGG